MYSSKTLNQTCLKIGCFLNKKLQKLPSRQLASGIWGSYPQNPALLLTSAAVSFLIFPAVKSLIVVSKLKILSLFISPSLYDCAPEWSGDGTDIIFEIVVFYCFQEENFMAACAKYSKTKTISFHSIALAVFWQCMCRVIRGVHLYQSQSNRLLLHSYCIFA